MARHRLDFPYTCPDIDREIEELTDALEDGLADLVTQVCSYIPQGEARNISAETVKAIVTQARNGFENVRRLNEQMRDQADTQLAELLEELTEATNRVTELEAELENAREAL